MSRWKKTLLRLLGLAVVAILGFVIWHGITNQRAQRSLAAFQGSLDQSDPGWRLEEILVARRGQFPPGDENPRALTDRAHKQIPKAFHEWQLNPTGGKQEDPWLPEIEKNHRPLEAHIKRATTAAEAAKEAIETARKLRFCVKDGGVDLVYPDPPTNIDLASTHNVRQSAALLQTAAVLSTLQGNPNRAIEDVQANLRAARAITGEPGVGSYMTRAAVLMIAIGNLERTLALAEPTQGLAELQADLAAEIARPAFYQGLRGERAIGNRFFENLNKSNGPAARFVIGLLSSMTDEQLHYLTKFTLLLEIEKTPYDRQRMTALQEAFVPHPSHVLTNLSLAAMEKTFQTEQRTQTLLRCALVAIACERHRQKHGRWPSLLTELTADLLPGGVPIDPYSGDPIRYRVYAGGVVVYGVGRDGKDDQGNLSARGEAGTDIGFRLWDRDRRGLEPLPEKAQP